MKPYGREKKIMRNIPDLHPHPKRKVKMWWDDMCDFLDRSAIKRIWKKEINEQLNEE